MGITGIRCRRKTFSWTGFLASGTKACVKVWPYIEIWQDYYTKEWLQPFYSLTDLRLFPSGQLRLTNHRLNLPSGLITL